MATLTGTKIANTYKQLLQVGSSNTGLTGSVQTVQDGQGNNSPLQLSQSAVNIDGTFQLSGVTLTANASTLNAVADLTGATGIVAVSAGNVYGRTITGGTGVSITNGDGTEGNPTIALNTTGVVSGTYGPLTTLEINEVGQIVSATAVSTSVSVPTIRASEFIGGTFKGTTADFSSDTSIGGTAVIEGAATFNSTVSVSGALTGSSATFTGTVSAGDISGANATFSGNISATEYYGDGSNLTGIVAASATFATSAGFAASATNASFALSATNANFAASASFASSASYAASAGEASFAVSASSAAFATSADSATFAVSATNATTAYNVSGGIADISGLTAVSASISDLRATQFYGTSVSIDYLNASDITAITISATDLKSSTLSFTSVSVSSLRVYRLAVETTLSATYGTFTGNVSAVSFYGDGSNLTNLPTAPTSVSSYTVNQLTVVSAASFPDDATLNFGTGNDLQILHNGSNSVIKETGTGSLFVQSNEIKLTNTGSFSMLTLADGQDADFPYGIQVSGTVSATSFVGPTITSINSVISNVSALTSVNAAAITSINVVVANVSALTSVNAAAITSINAIIEGDVSADSGTFNTLTVITSASIGGTLNVGGNVSIGGDLTAGATTVTGLDVDGNLEQHTATPTINYRLTGTGNVNVSQVVTTLSSNAASWDIRTMPSFGGGPFVSLYAAYSEVKLRTGNTDALTIDSSQNATIAGALTVTDNTGVFIELTDTATAPDASWRIYPQTGNTTRLLRFTDYNTGTPQDRMVIDGSGNVGIGTSSPSSYNNYANNLVVYENGNAGITITSNTTSSASIHFADGTAGDEAYRGIVLYNHSGDNMRFYTSAAERMRIDSSGNVGIGTTSPVAQFESQAASGTLQTRTKVTGSTASDIAELAISTGTRTHLIQSKGSSGDFVIRDSTGATDRITMDTSGNVGIGTSSPTTPLTVAGKGTFSGAGSFEALELITSDANRVYVTGNSSVNGDMWRLGTSASNPYLNIDALQSNGEILLRTGGTNERVRITSTGNVGIGTSSPAVRLHVSSGASNEVARFEGTNTPYISIYDTGVRQAYWISSTSIILRTENSKNLDIGTLNPNAFLFTTNNTERMRIDSSGNVGIGTSSPVHDLHIYRSGSAASIAAVSYHATPGSYNQSSIHLESQSASSSTYDYSFAAIGSTANITRESVNHITLVGGQTVFNEDGGNLDFRVEGDTDTNLLFADASTDRVGIGTSSPSQKLTVSGNIALAGGGNMFSEATSSTYSIAGGNAFNNGGSITFGGSTSGVIAGGLIFNSGTGATNSEAMRIDSSGNVGIGTTSSTHGKLEVRGGKAGTGTSSAAFSTPGAAQGEDADLALYSTFEGSADNGVRRTADIIAGFNGGVWGNEYLSFNVGNNGSSNDSGVVTSEKMRINSSGNVGIGTTSPATVLHTKAGSNLETDWIFTAQNNAGTAVTEIGGYGYNHNLYHKFWINDSEKMRIDSSGNVGIGTTSPVKKLHVNGPALATIGTLTDGATITPNFDTNQNFSVTLAGNRTLANPSNIDAGQTGSIFVVQDGTGSRTLSFGSYWKFAGGTAPTLSTAAGSVDRIDYIVYTTTAIHAVATLNVS